MPKIILHPQARTELFDAAIYYDDCRDGLGTEFLDELEATFALIKSHIEIGPVMRRSCRRVLLFRFPYGIIWKKTSTSLRLCISTADRVTGWIAYGTCSHDAPHDRQTFKNEDLVLNVSMNIDPAVWNETAF